MLRRGYPVEPANGPGFCEVAWDLKEPFDKDSHQNSREGREDHTIEEEELSIPKIKIEPGAKHDVAFDMIPQYQQQEE